MIADYFFFTNLDINIYMSYNLNQFLRMMIMLDDLSHIQSGANTGSTKKDKEKRKRKIKQEELRKRVVKEAN